MRCFRVTCRKILLIMPDHCPRIEEEALSAQAVGEAGCLDAFHHIRTQVGQPEGGAFFGGATFALDQHLQGRILDIEDAAHVQGEHTWPVLCNKRPDLVANLLGVGKELWSGDGVFPPIQRED